MNISLENWLRNKLQETEEMHDYSVATETVRIWIGQYKQETEAANPQQMSDVTRVEVISNEGRDHINRCNKGSVSLSMQDEGRTLKVFIEEWKEMVINNKK